MQAEASRTRPGGGAERTGQAHEDFLTGRPGATMSAEGLNEIRDAVARAGASWRSLTVQSHQHVVLSTEAGHRTAVQPTMLHTTCLATYKRWIGVDDAVIRARPEGGRYWPVPERGWSRRKVATAAEFTDQERADIEQAAHAYLFGDSAGVADYRDAIELCRGPFEAAVYTFADLAVMPSGRLTVLGAPAILLCDSLDLHEPGQIAIYTPCHAHFGSVRKFPGVQLRN